MDSLYKADCFAFNPDKFNCKALTKIDCRGCAFYKPNTDKENNALIKQHNEYLSTLHHIKFDKKTATT